MWRSMLLTALGAVGAAPVAGVAEPANESQSEYEVVEVFEVGRDIYVRALAEEPEAGSLWVGTSMGVHEVDLATQELRQTFTRADGLANEYVFAIYVDDGGYKWFGTNGGGVSRYRDGEWQVYFPMHGLADYWVYSFAQRGDGSMWIGTWAGANRWQVDLDGFETYVDELVNEWVYGLGVDSQDRVWFGTEGGVSMFDGHRWREWTHADGLGAANSANLPISLNTGLGTRSRHDLSVAAEDRKTYNPNYVFSLLVAADDTVWAGTWGGGVSRYDGRTWTNFTSADGLAGDIVYSITEAPDGSLWFGTDHGLSRYDGQAWQSYARRDGILDNHIYAVAVVANGEIWVGTRGGVTRMRRRDDAGMETQ